MTVLKRWLLGGIERGLVPARRIETVARNEDFIKATLGFVLADSADDRDQAALAFLNVAARRQLRRLAPDGLRAAKGRAEALLETPGVRYVLEQTEHLGALAAISPIRPTRLDYVALILDQLLQLKKARLFPGLGSKPNDWSSGTTLELLQCWAVLHNWGHLFGTFATERGVLYSLDREPNLESQLFATHNIHEQLRAPVRELVATKNLYHLFYALAALQASTELHGKTREDACTALAVYFDHQKRGSAQHEVYKRVRQLAYHRLHSIMRLERTCDFAAAPATVSELLDVPELRSDEKAPPPPLVQLLKSFDVYQGQELFLSPKAASLALHHNRALKHWWHSHRSDDVLVRVQQLFTKPPDWPREQPDDLRHWLRLRVDGDGERWLEEVRMWAENGHWSDGNYIVTPIQGERAVSCDVYLKATLKEPSTPLVAGVGRAMAKHCERALQGTFDEVLGRSVGKLIVALLRLLLKDKVNVELERAPGMEALGWAVALSGGSASRELKRLAEQVGNAKRKEEVRTVVADIQRHEFTANQVVLAVIGTTRLLDAESGQVRKEIDGVWCVLDDEKVAWRFLEEKTSRATGREGQLAELAPFLRYSLSTPERVAEERTVAGASCTWTGTRPAEAGIC